MRCFPSGKPVITSSEKIRNTKAQSIYTHTSELFNLGGTRNYNSTICLDASGIKKAHSYDLHNSLSYGFALCYDCSGMEQGGYPNTNLSNTYGIYTTMDTTNMNFVDISCNYMDGSCNYDMLYDENGVLTGWSVPAPGMVSIIDPSNLLIGACDCDTKKYLDYVQLETEVGQNLVPYSDLSGNDTNTNYLRMLGSRPFTGSKKLI